MAFRVIGRKKGAQGLFARDRAINSRAVAAFEKALAKPPKPEHHSVFDTGDRSEVRNFLHDHVDPGVFAPDAVRTLIAAFDGAWQSIVASGARLSGQQSELMRELLAKYIIEKARQGELDECRLRDGALRRLAHSNLRYPPPVRE
jgi:hypothetical protein